MGDDITSMEAYTSYMDEHSTTYVVSNMGVANIPIMRNIFQISSFARIRIPEEIERDSFYRPEMFIFTR